MPLIISKHNNNIQTEAICFNDGPFGDVLSEWKDDHYEIHAGEPLRSFYLKSLEKAKELELASLSMPLLSQNRNVDALRISTDTIREFLESNELDVYLLLEDKEAIPRTDPLYADIRDYLDRNLPGKHQESFQSEAVMPAASFKNKNKEFRKKKESETLGFQYKIEPKQSLEEASSDEEIEFESFYAMPDMAMYDKEERFIPDESFSECLIRMIDEREMTDPEVYKKANIDRKHFNHIKNTRDYRPRKETAVALAIGMKLDMNDTNTLLERAGFVLSRSSKFDLIIRYCIEHGIYNIFEINEILFAEDQKLLGC